MSQQWTVLLGGAILILFAAECRDRQFRQALFQDRARLRRNLLFLGASLAALALLQALGERLHSCLPALGTWGTLQAAELAGCFLLAELLGWLLHYVKHRNSFLWSFHFQHHRESHYNLWLAVHTHALEVISSGLLTTAALALAGFSRGCISIYLLFYTLVKVYQHSALSYTLGPLNRLVVGPAYHRLHHEMDSRCNYAVSLTVFDILFKTARWPDPGRAPSSFGVSEEQELPFGFWAEMLHFLHRRR